MIFEAPQYYSGDFQAARARILAVADNQGHRVESFLHPLVDSEGQELAMDAIWCGRDRREAERLLIVSSGLHGLEGPLGSACQLAALQAGDLHSRAVANGWTVLLLHGLNPFGCAYRRRWNEANMDLNRNFWLPEDERSTTEIYRQLEPWLNPKKIPWHDGVGFFLKSVRHIVRYGFDSVKQAIGVGQYDFPQGLLYGGNEPSWTRKILEQQLPGWLAGRQLATQIDVHSGLGKWGRCMLILDYVMRPEHQRRLLAHPRDSWEAASPAGTSYNAVGTLARWCDTRFHDHQYMYLCAEVGTYNPVWVLRALRAENQQWHHEPHRSPAVVRRVQEAFCPRSPKWRSKAVNELWRAIVRTIESP